MRKALSVRPVTKAEGPTHPSKERKKKANMIKTDLDESIMVKLNNKGKGTSKKLLSEMKRN